ncbi:hypothetical protein GCM10028805_60200 [Spirosoma harenae]
MPRPISDQVSRITLEFYVGNSLTYYLLLADEITTPELTTSRLYSAPGGRLMPPSWQPVVSFTGQIVTIAHPPIQEKFSGYHQVKLGERVILAGDVVAGYGTVARPKARTLPYSMFSGTVFSGDFPVTTGEMIPIYLGEIAQLNVSVLT